MLKAAFLPTYKSGNDVFTTFIKACKRAHCPRVESKLKADFDYKNVILKIRINDVNSKTENRYFILFGRVVSVQK